MGHQWRNVHAANPGRLHKRAARMSVGALRVFTLCHPTENLDFAGIFDNFYAEKSA